MKDRLKITRNYGPVTQRHSRLGHLHGGFYFLFNNMGNSNSSQKISAQDR